MNPLMTFPNQEKNQYTVLFIDKMAALYRGETRISIMTNETSQWVGNR